MLAKRLRASFHRAINERFGKEVNCSMSVGIASLLLSRPMSPQQIIAQADAALYAAKRAPGDTRVMICTPDGNSAQPADSVAA
ncbi:MAG: hypothetical protein VYC34_06200, partial [Planctomycetota bacterium]|nr:hypothetical protein [Planctomycetota bacterium]